MIKTAIIIILILLLIITLYSYYCLSSRMVNFEKLRLEYILTKEGELNDKEKNIKTIADCSNKNDSYQEAIKNINSIIGNLNLPPGSICQKYIETEEKKTINDIKSIVLQEKLPMNSSLNNCANNIPITIPTLNTNINSESIGDIMSEN